MTAHEQLELYELMEKLADDLLYSEKDSVCGKGGVVQRGLHRERELREEQWQRRLIANEKDLFLISLSDARSVNKEIQKVCTQYVHHRDLSIVYIIQNLFVQRNSEL